jgi:hypothetical protein
VVDIEIPLHRAEYLTIIIARTHSLSTAHFQAAAEHDTSPNDTLPVVLPSGPLGSSSNSEHTYQQLPWTSQVIVVGYLQPFKVGKKWIYICIWPEHPKESFGEEDNACVHAHKHVGTEKLFECTVTSR